LHVADLVQRLAERIEMPGSLHIGRLPPERWADTAVLEPAPGGMGVWARACGRPLGLGWRLLSVVESLLFRKVGNSLFWRTACFPSSNGFLNGAAVARMYGALANNGSVEAPDGSALRMLRQETVDELREMLADRARWLPRESGQSSESRVSGGFSPWWNERLHGSNAPRCFGHNGMNGCAAYADPDAGLALVVLKNVYDPQLAYDGPGDDVAELFAAVRAEVVEGGE